VCRRCRGKKTVTEERGEDEGHFGLLNWSGPHVNCLNAEKWMELERNGIEGKEV
jgi:hypothetical protein